MRSRIGLHLFLTRATQPGQVSVAGQPAPAEHPDLRNNPSAEGQPGRLCLGFLWYFYFLNFLVHLKPE